jgi:predicted alpha/beta superfamily hydrolase
LFASALTADEPAGEPIGIGERFMLRSQILGEERGLFVHLPARYDATTERYPVLYLTDAETQFVHTSATVDFLARNGLIPAMIVVGITNTDRTRDLTPSKATMTGASGNVVDFPSAGGAGKFLSFIVEEVRPWVESRYRTKPYRVFAGHSFGGLFAVWSLFERPAAFDAWIAVSPTLFWDDSLPKRTAETHKAQDKKLDKTLVVTVGNEGQQMAAAFADFRRALKTLAFADLDWEMITYPEDDHGSVVLKSHEAGLRRVFAGWRFPRDPDNGRISGGLADVESHYAALSRRLGIEVSPPEVLVNLLGYQMMGDGDLDKAIRIFERNRDLYPQSANVYDSLAEAHENAGRLEDAAAGYQRAVEIGSASSDPATPIYQRNLDRVKAAAAATPSNG